MVFFLGVFGTDFFLALSKEKSFLVVFVEVLIMMVIYFGSALILLLFIFVRVLIEFRDLLLRDRSSWPRCLLWHGWLPLLSGVNGGHLGLRALGKVLLIFLSVLLGGILLVSFLSGGCLLILMLRVWLEGLLRNLMFGLMVVWLMTGCLALLLLGLGALFTGSVGSGLVGGGVIGMMMLVMVLWFLLVVVSAQFLGLCRQFRGLWGVILALQADDGVHLGVDNLGVVRHVGRIVDGRVSSRPRELLPDGDLLLLVERMLHFRVLSTVRICKVKGHADEALVRAGTVRELDRLGNNGADEAADFWS